MDAKPIPRLYTAREVADLRRGPVGTIHNHVSQGKIRPIQRGVRPLLFTEAEVRRYLGLEEGSTDAA